MKKYIAAKSALVLLAVFAIMLVLNHLMPLHRDDYDYSLVWLTTEHVGSLSDVIESCYRHYLYHGGRMVTVFFLVLFLYLGKFIFDILNALMFTALIALIYCHARREVRLVEPGILAAVALLTWLALPHFAEVAVWKSGSTVYLWSAVPVMLFLLPYNLYNRAPWKSKRNYLAPIMLVLGVIAGWSVENLAVTVVGITALLAGYHYAQKNLPLWMATGTIGAACGLLGLIAAPGNYVRYDEQSGDRSLLLTILDHIGKQFAAGGEALLYVLPVVLLMYTIYQLYRRVAAQTSTSTANVHSAATSRTTYIIYGIIAALIVSYFSGGFIALGVLEAVRALILTSLGLTDAHTLKHLYNLQHGFEETFIYWGIIIMLYRALRARLGLRGALSNRAAASASRLARLRAILSHYSAARYAAVLVALALFNHVVMLAAPTFPARATFSSVVMLLIACTALLRDSTISAALASARRLLVTGAAIIGGFTIISSIVIGVGVSAGDAEHIQDIEAAAARGEHVVTMEPIANQHRRMLRHVYYEDFDNGTTKHGVVIYYGLDDIRLDPIPD